MLGRLVAGAALAGGLVVAALGSAQPVAAASHPAPPNATTLYHEALATTHSWSVHYVSSSTEAQVSLLESGDAGPASGTQTVATGKGNLNDTITIDVIGGLTYVKGNAGGLVALAGLNTANALQAAGKWIEFSTNDAAFSEVVVGVRSHDVATELELKGPLTLGHASTIDGIAVDAVDGTQGSGKKSMRVVLYVRRTAATCRSKKTRSTPRGSRPARCASRIRTGARRCAPRLRRAHCPSAASAPSKTRISWCRSFELRSAESQGAGPDPGNDAEHGRMCGSPYSGRTGADRAAGPELPGE